MRATVGRGDIGHGVMFGLTAALAWAVWSVATRAAVTTTLGPLDVMFLRFGFSALVLWPFLPPPGLAMRRATAWRVAVMLCGAGLPFMLLASAGSRFAPATHLATLTIGMMPIFLAVLSTLVLGKRPAPRQIVGLLAVAVGLGAMGWHALIANRAAGEWRGDLLFLVAGALFAASTLAQRSSGLTTLEATASVHVSAGALFAPVYLALCGSELLAVPLRDLFIQSLVQGFGVAVLGLYCHTQACIHLGATRAAVFGGLVPAISVLLSIPWLAEWPAASEALGIAFITMGVMIVVTGERPPLETAR